MANLEHLYLLHRIRLQAGAVTTHLFYAAQIGFALCLLVVYARRYVRLRRRVSLLGSQVLAAHERERMRLSRELHDGVLQSMQAIRLSLQTPPGKEAALDGGVIAHLQECIDYVRSVARDLRPAVASATLASMLKSYGETVSQRSDVKISAGNTADLVRYACRAGLVEP